MPSPLHSEEKIGDRRQLLGQVWHFGFAESGEEASGVGDPRPAVVHQKAALGASEDIPGVAAETQP